MERCDFASITSIIRSNLLEGAYDNQLEFIETLFSSYLSENDVYFDMGLVCKWLNGLTKLSPAIGQFYVSDTKKQTDLSNSLEDAILPCLSDSSMVVQQIHDLLIQDSSISDRKKAALCQLYPCMTDTEEAYFITDVLCFGMTRPFVKRDVRKPNLLTLGNASPVLKDFVFDEGVPNPCRYFCGREQELTLLHEALIESSKVFLYGIAGIGKSELAKAYAKEHKKEYTNILYLTYTGDLRQDIIDMDFADDLPEDDETTRFRKHNRFMRTLKEDTLFIIDNFNTTSTQDEFLSVILKYRCRILFTTRSLIPGQKTIHLEEISDPEALFRLASKFYSNANQNRHVLEQIIMSVHSHTLAVELAARLLESGILEPQEVLEKLQEEKANFSAADKIGITKDGKSRKATYYDHIHRLFSLFHLSLPHQEIMSSLSLIPASGIPARLFGKWMGFHDLNEINELVELGFVQSRTGNIITLHPMIQEVTISDVPPTITGCHTLLESIRATCQLHGVDMPYYKVMFQTIENTMALAKKDDMPFYLLLLEDVFQYMENYHYEAGMKQIISEMTTLLSDKSVGTVSDRALLLDCKSALEKNTKKAIKLLEEALNLLSESPEENVLLTSNLHSNLGGLYRLSGKNLLAKQHMEAAISILNEHGLIGYHDSIVQIVNYAVLLNDIGEPEQGLVGLRKIARTIKELHTENCSDYAIIQQTMGSLSLSAGKPDQAVQHFRKALSIYQFLFGSNPELLAEKQQEILEICHMAGLTGNLPFTVIE